MSDIDAKSYYPTQIKNLNIVFSGTKDATFGVERIVRVVLVILAFPSFGGLIKAIAGWFGFTERRTSIDFLSIGKVIFSWFAIQHGWTTNQYFTWFIIYLAADSLHGLLSRIFLNDLWRKPVSYERNLMLALINYLELILCFAAIYNFQDRQVVKGKLPAFAISDTTHKCPYLTADETIYFSAMTATTVGYGDISPRDTFVRRLVGIQAFLSLVFIVMIIANLAGKLGTTYKSIESDVPKPVAKETTKPAEPPSTSG